MRLRWMIGGAQGTGVDTSANIFGGGVARAGYYIYGSREYFSNIKGRHSYFSVVISEAPQHSIDSKVDVLASFDAETVFQHFDEVNECIIYDKSLEAVTLDTVRSMEPGIAKAQAEILESAGFGITVLDAVKYVESKGAKAFAIDYGKLISKITESLQIDSFVSLRARNTICVGASFAVIGLPAQHLLDSTASFFANNEKFLKLNTMAAQLGMLSAQSIYSLKELPKSGHRVQVDGNTLSALGKLYGGLRFQSYYPITPASDESTFIEANQLLETLGQERHGVVVLQTEDELAAINAANGAALTGARSATATSGPGFSLMNEGISWAGMNEVPVVVTYYMRGAPATGLPTRSGQSDLKLALNAGHGEFARIAIASGDHSEVFGDAVLALNLAEVCQTPVIHIIEKSLANAYAIVDEQAIGVGPSIKIDRGKIVFPSEPESYKRFEITEDGVSPRAFLGHAKIFYTGDEHNEYGHITEGTKNRTEMYEKRMRKLEVANKYLQDSQKLKLAGEKNSEIALLTWGSPKGAILDAIDELARSGISAEMVQVRVFSPYPKELVMRELSGKKTIIAVENNYNAQGAQVMREQTGMEPTNYILKWNGRPIARDELVEAIEQIVNENTKRVVLNGGK